MKNYMLVATFVLGCCMLSFGQISDGSFEEGANGGIWTEASTNYGTPICDTSFCGTGGGNCAPHTGSYFAWFGGALAIETGSVEQSVYIPFGSPAHLDLYVKVANIGAQVAADRLEISIDGNVLQTITSLDFAAYENYTLLNVDLSSFTDGAVHTVRIEGFQSTATTFNVLVDDVTLTVEGLPADLFENELSEKDISVFPNPVANELNLKFRKLAGDAVVSVRSINGAVVSKETLNEVFNKTFTLNTTDFDNGVYFVEILNGGNITTERVVIAK